MSAGPEYSPASPADAGAIRRLLEANGLPHDDIAPHLGDFLVARSGDEVMGVAGLEMLGEVALLRSVAVREDQRRSGIARRLCEKALARASQRGAARVYLLTTDAAGYFRDKLGFAPLERSSAPAPIQGTHEFSRACPQSASLLVRHLNEHAP